MRVSNKRTNLLSSESTPEMNDAKRQRTKSPLRSLSAASHQSPSLAIWRDDVEDVPVLSDCDADVAESFVSNVFAVDDAAALLILSLSESRERLSSNQDAESDVCICEEMRPCTVAAVSGPSSSIRRVSRVRFDRDPVSCVKVIPSHRSLTKEQKRSMYRGTRKLQAEAEKNYLECDFERSRDCFKNALEEDCFFRDRRGTLVHPAHWSAFVNDIGASLAVDSSVPPGFSSLDEYFDHLFAYELYYDNAVQTKVFAPSDF